MDTPHLAYELFLKHIIEGKIEEEVEVTGRRGIRRKLVLFDLKEREDTGI